MESTEIIQTIESSEQIFNAIKSHNLAEVEQLLNSGTNVNQKNNTNFGDTPLIYAIYYRATQIIELLIKHPQIDFYKTDSRGRTPLMTACVTHSEKVFKDLINRLDLYREHEANNKSNTQSNFFYTVCETKNSKFLEQLLVNDIPSELFERTSDGLPTSHNPLTLALKRGNWNIVRLLLIFYPYDIESALVKSYDDDYIYGDRESLQEYDFEIIYEILSGGCRRLIREFYNLTEQDRKILEQEERRKLISRHYPETDKIIWFVLIKLFQSQSQSQSQTTGFARVENFLKLKRFLRIMISLPNEIIMRTLNLMYDQPEIYFRNNKIERTLHLMKKSYPNIFNMTCF
jgi:hypothetical protein